MAAPRMPSASCDGSVGDVVTSDSDLAKSAAACLRIAATWSFA